jgi:hypothetical protein
MSCGLFQYSVSEALLPHLVNIIVKSEVPSSRVVLIKIKEFFENHFRKWQQCKNDHSNTPSNYVIILFCFLFIINIC